MKLLRVYLRQTSALTMTLSTIDLLSPPPTPRQPLSASLLPPNTWPLLMLVTPTHLHELVIKLDPVPCGDGPCPTVFRHVIGLVIDTIQRNTGTLRRVDLPPKWLTLPVLWAITLCPLLNEWGFSLRTVKANERDRIFQFHDSYM